MSEKFGRRSFFKKSLASTAGLSMAFGFEEKNLLARKSSPKEILNLEAGEFPRGKIKDVEISRMIVGGNLTSGFAHSRDLIYVSPLLNHYFTDEKIFETWQLCEQYGLNTAILRLDNKVISLITRYWKEIGGKIQWIAQCKMTEKDLYGDVTRAIDTGAIGAFLHGGVADSFVSAGKVELLGKVVEYLKQNEVIAGIAGHMLEVPMAVEKAGIDVDFYMKTFNSGNYWTAGPRLINGQNWIPDPEKEIVPEYENRSHDNIWSVTPEQTSTFMRKVKKPWIAYKVLGAGAIHPKDGFKYAFEGGADFVNIGMFDFQVQENAVIAKNLLSGNIERKRPWMA